MLIFALTTMPFQQHAPYQGLYAWGSAGTYYNLGALDNLTYNSPVLTINENVTSWRSLSTGGTLTANGAFSGGIDSLYRLWMWGNNDQYQLQTGDTSPVTGVTYSYLSSPQMLTSAELTNYSWKSLSVSEGYGASAATSTIMASAPYAARTGTYILAIRSDNRLFSWGYSPYYCLGQGSTTFYNRKPTEVSGGGYWSKVYAGVYGAAGIRTDGRLYRWGFATGNGSGSGDAQYNIPTLLTTGSNTTFHARYVSTGVGTSSPVFASSLSYTHVGIKSADASYGGSVYVTGPYLNLARNDYTRTVFHAGSHAGYSFGYYSTNQTSGLFTTLAERVQSDTYNIPDSDPNNPTFAGPAINIKQNYYFTCMGKLYGQGLAADNARSPVIYFFGNITGTKNYPSEITNFPSSTVSAVGVTTVLSSPMVLGKDGYLYTSSSLAYDGYGKSMYSWYVIGTATDTAGLSYAVQGASTVSSIVMATAPWGATSGRSAVDIVHGSTGNRLLVKLDDNSLYGFAAGTGGSGTTALDGDSNASYAVGTLGTLTNPFKPGSFTQMMGAGGTLTLPTGSFGGKFYQNNNVQSVLGGANYYYLANYEFWGGGSQNEVSQTYRSIPTGGAALNYDFTATGNMNRVSGSWIMVSCGATGVAAITTDFRLRQWGNIPYLSSMDVANYPYAWPDSIVSPNIVTAVSMGASHAAMLYAPGSSAANIIRLTGAKANATSTITMTDTTGISVGNRVLGDGIPEQTFVKSVAANTSINVTNNVLGTDPTVNLTFVPGVTGIYHWGDVYGNGTFSYGNITGSWIFVDAGFKTTAAISASTTLPAGTGRLFMWGQNNNYQLGTGNNTAKLSVGTALGTSTWRKVSIAKISPTNVLGILSNYNLRSWGYHGQTYYATGIAPTYVNLAFDMASGSTSLYGSSVAGLAVGMEVSGTGIQAGTVINSIDSVNFIVLLSLPATSTISGATLLFTGGVTSATIYVSTPTALGGEYWKDVKATGYGGYGIQTVGQGDLYGSLWSWGGNSSSELGSGIYGDQSSRVYSLPDLANGKEGSQIGVDVYNQATKNYYLNSGSNAISTADTSGIAVGATVIGTGIPGNTSVVSVVDSTSITLSNNATYTGLASGLSFFSLYGTARSNWMMIGGGTTTRTAVSDTINS
jgi:hypothetical protein